jgi:hypothetical protein
MNMNDRQREIVQIGVSGARIVAVTHQRIDYIDIAGQEQFIDLEECAGGWGRLRDAQSQLFLPLPGATEESIAAGNACCVGQRDTSANPPWTEFMNKRNTRFEFATYEAVYTELLGPLRQAGWHTFDLS